MRSVRGTEIGTSLTDPGSGYSDSFADKLRRFRLDGKLDLTEALTLLDEVGVELSEDDRIAVAALIAGVSQRAFAKSRISAERWDRTVTDPVVYFFRHGEHIKIGTTAHGAESRLARMQLPPGTELVALIPDASHAEERELHRRFAADRIAGEWFKSSPELESLIETFGVSKAS